MHELPSRRTGGLILILLAALLAVLPARVRAQGNCERETADLETLARAVTASIAAPETLTAGGSFRFAWQAQARFPDKMPVYLALAVPGDIRVAAAPINAKPDASADRPSELPGVIALPAGARAPFGLTFAADKSRLLVPLHLPGSKLAGDVAVHVYEAGALALEAKLVARTACGERILAVPLARSLIVSPGAPEIVVQDPYDLDVPQSVVISNSGRYRLHVFEARYRVFDLVSGAKIIDRAGYAPNFSPTSRFLIADVGDRDGLALEVVDLASREVIYTARGPFLGWAHGDAFLIDGGARLGALSVRQSLLSRPADPDAGDLLNLDAPGSCNACASWSHAPMTLDLDNGIIVFADTFRGTGPDAGEVYELATGFKACCLADPPRAPATTSAAGGNLKEIVGRRYEIAPAIWPTGWHAREPIGFSHIYDPTKDNQRDDPSIQEQDWFKAAMPLRTLLVGHRQLDPQTASMQIAQAMQGATVRGDWRAKARVVARGPDAPSAQEALLTALSSYGIVAAPPLAREATPFSNSPASEDARARYSSDDKAIEEAIKRRSQALEKRLLADVPALKPHLAGRRKAGELPEFPYDGDLTKAKISLADHLEGLWRWQIDGAPVWLLQLLTVEGSAAVGSGALVLMAGEAKPGGILAKLGSRKGGRLVNLSKDLEGLWSGDYGKTAQQTRLKPQVFFGRTLVVASVISRTIGVYDLKEGKSLALVQNVPQADLLADVLLTVDGRHVLQLNSDGQFFLHEVATGRLALGGRSVDGEIILYTPEGYYWSSYEGAHFVQLRFPGLPGLYSFQQFAAVLDRPALIKARLAKADPVAPPRLTPPPVVEARLVGARAASPRVAVNARSTTGLARLRLFEDGQLMHDLALSGAAFQGEIEVPATTSARWLTALATDTAGFVSAPQAMRLEPVEQPTSRLHGVLVGVDSYADPQLKLTYAKSDARRLAEALGASVGRYYGARELALLLDDAATPEAILSGLERAVAAAGHGDTIIFSFAGHGLKGDDDRYYLTPSGFGSGNVKGTGLAWTRVAAILGRAKSRVVVILDSCHSGLSGSEGLGTNDDAVTSLLSGAHAPMLVLAASKGRQLSYEDPKWGGGVFTHALVEALQRDWKGTDVDGNGAIEVSELYRALKSTVARETEGQQTPWLARQDLIGDFALF